MVARAAALVVRSTCPHVLIGPRQVFLFGAMRGHATQAICSLEQDHGELIRAVLDLAERPISREVLVARVLERAGGDHPVRAPVDEAIDLLLKWGSLVEDGREDTPRAREVGGAHVVVCVTGAIGAAYAPLLVERLVSSGTDVRVAMTRAALRFTTARTFRAITHAPVATSLFRGRVRQPAPHVALAAWADVLVVYPCTATTIARLAAGDCSDIVSATCTATRGPVLLAPSMNAEMFAAPAVIENLERLRERGFFIAHPASGREVAEAPLARVARGGVAPPPSVVQRYVAWLLERVALAGPRVLSLADWDAEHGRQEPAGQEVDQDLSRAIDAREDGAARVLEVGTGLGALARYAAKRGHCVVAIDASRRAIALAAGFDRGARVTWAVDDVTDSAVHGSFDVCVDRGCFGCIPLARRQRYVDGVASLVRPGGALLLKVYQTPARELRAFGFTREEIAALFAPAFAIESIRESTLRFGRAPEGPALLFELVRSPG